MEENSNLVMGCCLIHCGMQIKVHLHPYKLNWLWLSC